METTKHRCTARAALEINSSKCAGFPAKQTSEPGDEASKGASNSAETGSPQSPPAANGRGSSGEAPPSKPRVTDFPHRCERASHQGSLATQTIRCQRIHQAMRTDQRQNRGFHAKQRQLIARIKSPKEFWLNGRATERNLRWTEASSPRGQGLFPGASQSLLIIRNPLRQTCGKTVQNLHIRGRPTAVQGC